jgi:threonine/homoserine/homoserine lactone efflux protein
MTFAALLTYTGALFVAALIPGPGVTALIARALGSGFRATFPMAIGMMLGDLVFLSAVIAGLAYIAESFSTAFMVIKYLGAVYLAYVAWKIWTAGILPQDVKAEKKTGIWTPLFSGLFTTLGNPKPMLFYVALVPTLIDVSSVNATGFIELVGATATVLTLVLGGYVLLAARARGLLQKPRQLKVLNRVAASFIAGAAAMIAVRAN